MANQQRERYRYSPGDGYVYEWRGQDTVRVLRVSYPNGERTETETDTFTVSDVASRAMLRDAVQAWKGGQS